uniref:Uncharacterized protein n=1 Tax=Avena sativa TaxID=4498 RepID=A0ACD5TH09_AVESA
MHTQHSSSYSGRLLTNEPKLRDAAMHNQLSASRSRNHATTFHPLKENWNDGHSMHIQKSSSYSGRLLTNEPSSKELRDAAMHNHLSASRSRNHAATFHPLKKNWNDGHSMDTENSSSYSGRVLTIEPGSNELEHAAMRNNLSASRSRNHAATFPSLKENSNDSCVVMLDETSASNSGARASASVPSRAQALEEIIQNIAPQQVLEQNNPGTHELGTFWLCHPGSEQSTSQRLMPNIGLPTVDIKGKRPAASEEDQIKVKILRLNVASFVAQGGLNSAAGVLIRNDSTAEFISASCFSPILRTEPTLLFAAACCKGIKIALSYQPTTIVLESHLLYMLRNPLYFAPNQQPDIVQLTDFLRQVHPRFVTRSISEESNIAACRLALNVLHLKESYMFFNDPPEWLVPYLEE